MVLLLLLLVEQRDLDEFKDVLLNSIFKLELKAYSLIDLEWGLFPFWDNLLHYDPDHHNKGIGQVSFYDPFLLKSKERTCE